MSQFGLSAVVATPSRANELVLEWSVGQNIPDIARDMVLTAIASVEASMASRGMGPRQPAVISIEVTGALGGDSGHGIATFTMVVKPIFILA